MIFIYKDLVSKYIERLTPNDIELYAKKNNINCTPSELNIIYSFIKDNYLELLNGNIKVLEKIRFNINPILYKQLLNLYIEYKEKYL